MQAPNDRIAEVLRAGILVVTAGGVPCAVELRVTARTRARAAVAAVALRARPAVGVVVFVVPAVLGVVLAAVVVIVPTPRVVIVRLVLVLLAVRVDSELPTVGDTHVTDPHRHAYVQAGRDSQIRKRPVGMQLAVLLVGLEGAPAEALREGATPVDEADAIRIDGRPVLAFDGRADQWTVLVRDLQRCVVRQHPGHERMRLLRPPELETVMPQFLIIAQLELLDVEAPALRAAVRILEVHQAIAVVVPTVPTDLGRHAARRFLAVRVVAVHEAVAVVVEPISTYLGRRLAALHNLRVRAHAIAARIPRACVVIVAALAAGTRRAPGNRRDLTAPLGVAHLVGAGVPVLAVDVRRAADTSGDLAMLADGFRGADVVCARAAVVTVASRPAGHAVEDVGALTATRLATIERAAVAVATLCRGSARLAVQHRILPAAARLTGRLPARTGDLTVPGGGARPAEIRGPVLAHTVDARVLRTPVAIVALAGPCTRHAGLAAENRSMGAAGAHVTDVVGTGIAVVTRNGPV
jgi:hypothetical protein